MYIKKSFGEKTFDVLNTLFLILLIVITLYPCYYVLVASVSSPVKIYEGSPLLLWPKDFAIYSYKQVIKDTQIWNGYRNTIFYVTCGTFLSVLLTTTAAFAASRKTLPGKNIIIFLIMFTMYFSGGLIPTYMVVRNLGLLNTPFAMILPQAVSTYNLIITLSYFRGMPESLVEAAKIDGASDFKVFSRIMVPLAKPIIAVISLYYAVAIWNNYFSALIYINDRNLYPLQLVLREILVQNDTTSSQGALNVSSIDSAAYAANIKYAIIVVSTVPILCLYPFIQKYFVKGVMIGAVKG